MRITLRQLEIFAAIYQEQTVTGAAGKIGLSQAATSQALAELENLLERHLFDRHGRRVVLNANGRELLPAAIQVLDRVREIEAGAGRQPPNLKLYASLTAGNYMLPGLIARFVRRHPDARFRVAIGNTGRVISSLVHFESDAGWIEGTASHPDLMVFPWREDELVVVAAPDHPLAGRRATASELANARWVLREPGSGTRDVFEEAIKGVFQLRHQPIEMGGIGAMKRAVMAGGGLTCISKSAVELEIKLGQLRRVYTPWLNLRRQIAVLIHREKYLDSGLREFLRFCRVPPLAKDAEGARRVPAKPSRSD
ncbi:MAG TPA: LysR substrate-binding domain-containing protein [Bryobacteraceae bacterium]|nr:LysR substrate-binding domain-containing protein [Bryobacteraceae bacterium]